MRGDAPAGEVFELADEVVLPAPAVDPGFVVSRAEVVEVGGGVGQQVPHDRQHGVADGDDGAFLAAAVGQPPVA